MHKNIHFVFTCRRKSSLETMDFENATVVTEVMKNQTLDEINRDKTNELIPVIVYIGVMILIGVVGNLHVFIVFSGSYKRNSTFKIFVLSLAIIDLATVTTTMPFEIMLMFYPVTFKNDLVCKTFRAISGALAASSVLLLVTIAFERFRRVNYPLKTQLDYTGSKVIAIIAIITGIVLAFPNGIIQGVKIIKLPNNMNNITGSQCGISAEFTSSNLVKVYSGAVFLIFTTSCVLLIVLYSIVLYRMKKEYKKRSLILSVSSLRCTQQSTSSLREDHALPEKRSDNTHSAYLYKNSVRTENTINQNSAFTEPIIKCISFKRYNLGNKTTISEPKETATSNPTTELCNSERHPVSHKKYPQTRRSQSSGYTTRKITRILFLITFVFCISYLPLFVLQIFEAVSPDSAIFHLQYSSYGVVYKFLNRLYFVNSVVNPIVYSFHDRGFRQRVKLFYGQKIV